MLTFNALGAARPSAESEGRGLHFESLEPRVLLNADLSFGADTELTLRFDQAQGYQLVDSHSTVVSSIDAATVESQNNTLTIAGGAAANTLILDVASLQSLNIDFIGDGSEPQTFRALADSDFELRASELRLDGKQFHLGGFDRAELIGGDGDNRFEVDGWAGQVAIEGGAGQDTLLGPNAAEVTWQITGDNAGSVLNTQFASIENLQGAEANRDTFILGPNGRVDGVVDGNRGGYDTLVVEGSHHTVTYTATGPDAGIIGLDDQTVRFAGLEPVTFSASSTDLVIDLSAVADAALLTDAGTSAGQMKVESVNLSPTFESPTFANPTHSLTLRLGAGDDSLVIDSLDAGFTGSLLVEGEGGTDSVTLKGSWALGAGDLTVTAERIEVDAAATVSAQSIILTAANTAPRTLDATTPASIITALLSKAGITSPDDILALNPATIDWSSFLTPAGWEPIVGAIDPLSYVG